MSGSASPSKFVLWQERLEQFHSSQQTIQQFCAAVGCSVATFYYWKRRLPPKSRATSTSAAKASSAFVPVLVGRGAVQPISIRIADGTRVAVPADALPALGLILEHAQRVAS